MELTFDDIIKVFEQTISNSCCEIEFCVNGMDTYSLCWMGKMRDRDNPEKYCHWFGLVEDGSQAYDYDNLEDFLNAKVFEGLSLKEVSDKIEYVSVNACTPDRETLLDMGYKL